MYIRLHLHVKYLLFLSDPCIKEIRIFFTDFSKNIYTLNFMKSVQWEPICSIMTDGQTDMTEPIVAFFSAIFRTRQKSV